MKIALLFVTLALACYGQTPGTAETKGACSPANTGDNNTFTITCGIGKAQGDQMLKILNKILLNQLDPNAVMTKLDEIQKDIHEIRARESPWVLSEDQSTRIIGFLKGTGKTFSFSAWHSPSDLRSKDFLKQLSDAITKGGWNVKEPVFHILTQDAAGIFIAVKDKDKPAPEGAILLQMALSAADVPSAGMSQPDLAEDAFELYVGQKPTNWSDPKKKE
jgi:hypothetical protein